MTDQQTNYLIRKEAAEYITRQGLRVAETTLGKLACIGGGPKYQKFGRTPVYLAEDLDAWILSRLSGPMLSSSKGA